MISLTSLPSISSPTRSCDQISLIIYNGNSQLCVGLFGLLLQCLLSFIYPEIITCLHFSTFIVLLRSKYGRVFCKLLALLCFPTLYFHFSSCLASEHVNCTYIRKVIDCNSPVSDEYNPIFISLRRTGLSVPIPVEPSSWVLPHQRQHVHQLRNLRKNHHGPVQGSQLTTLKRRQRREHASPGQASLRTKVSIALHVYLAHVFVPEQKPKITRDSKRCEGSTTNG